MTIASTFKHLLFRTTCYLVLMLSVHGTVRQGYSFGLFVSEEPMATSSTARVMVAKTPTGLRYYLQGKAATEAEAKAFWLIPMPNVVNLDENPPLINSIDPALLQELADMTAPIFEGSCDDEPNGDIADAKQVFSSEAIPLSYAYPFNAQKLSPPLDNPEAPSQLHDFLIREGISITEEIDNLIFWASDQNLMILVVEYEERYISEGASPALEIDITVPPETPLRVALKQLTSTVMGTSTDFVFYAMGDTRFRANFPTRELDLSPVSFTSADTTDYLMQFDVTVLAQQSQVFITEYVGNLDPSTFADERLATLRNELRADKLTRLRARLIGAALRTNAEIITLRGDMGGNYTRAHRVPGFECLEMAGEMAGEDAGEMAGEMAGEDAGEMAGEAAGEEGGEMAGEMAGEEEAGEIAGDEAAGMNAGEDTAGEAMSEEMSASSDDGGCQSNTTTRQPTWLVIFLAFFLIRLRRVRQHNL